MVAAPRKLWFVFCAALASASVSCVGGPTSDYPSHGDDDQSGGDDDDGEPGPPGRADGGVAPSLDAAVMRDASAPSQIDGDAGDAGDASQPRDAGDGGAPLGLGAPLDGGSWSP